MTVAARAVRRRLLHQRAAWRQTGPANGTWSALGRGMSDQVNDLTVFDDAAARRSARVASSPPRAVCANNIAKWNGDLVGAAAAG
jgi:hypothetical protein